MNQNKGGMTMEKSSFLRVVGKSGSIWAKVLTSFTLLLAVLACFPLQGKQNAKPWSPVEVPGPDEHPSEMLKLAQEFRSLLGWGTGIPDYAAVVQRQKQQLPLFRARLDSLAITNWSVHCRVDYLLLRSEMDALEETEKILSQGRKNLVEIVPELANIALRHPGGGYYTEGGQLKYIVENYRKWAEITAKHFPVEEAKKLVPTAIKAAEYLLEFGNWLEKNRNNMPGKYYIAKEIHDWYLRHVNLMPFDTDQIRFLAEMERARALSYLQFEIHKNRHLPKIEPAKTTEEYLAWDDETALILRRWYLENGEDLLSDREYMADVRSEEGLFLLPFWFIAFPYIEKPGVFCILVVPSDHWRAIYSNMGCRTDPAVLHGHEYWPGHYYEGQIWRHSPCPIRQGHRDRHHIGSWCYWHEELPVALDFPFVRGPRARELPYLPMLQRAERILTGSDVLLGKISTDAAYSLFQERNPPLGSRSEE